MQNDKKDNGNAGDEITDEEEQVASAQAAQEAAASLVLDAEASSHHEGSSTFDFSSFAETVNKTRQDGTLGNGNLEKNSAVKNAGEDREKRAASRRTKRDAKNSAALSTGEINSSSTKEVALTPAKLTSVVGKEKDGTSGTALAAIDEKKNDEKKKAKANWRSDDFALGAEENAAPGAVRIGEHRDSLRLSDIESAKQSSTKSSIPRLKTQMDGEVVNAAIIDEDALQREFENKLKADMVQAAEVDVYEDPGFCQRNAGKIGCLSFIIIVALAVGLGVGLSSVSDGAQTTTNITNSPTVSPTLSGDYDYLKSLFSAISGNEVLDDATPQAQALESIYDESQNGVFGVRDVTEQYLKERYALRVLYYSTQGNAWGLADSNFTSTLGTCSWMNATSGNRMVCNEREEVTDLFLNVINMNGTIPSELGVLSSLSQLSLAKNELYGTIPSSLGDLTDMKFLQLAINTLSGTIPTTFEQFTKMERLILHINELTGTLPNVWGDSFVRLRINDNKMNGTIPAMPTQMPLDWFQVSDNDFSGTLPRNLASQPNLMTLAVSNNKFEGTIPEQYGALTSLLNFVIDGNMFNSSLPAALGRFEDMDWFWVNNNAFTGTLPSTFGAMTKATQFRFENNMFTGTLPSEWSGLEDLLTLDVSNNPDLVGTVPASYTTMGALSSFSLEGTQLSGGLTETFCASQQLASITAECGGATPTIECPCCTICCEGDNCLLSNLTETCLNRAETLQDFDSFRDATCECPGDGTLVSCTEACESCSVDGTSCVKSTNYGHELDPETGNRLNFFNDFEYVEGPYNGTLLSFRETVIDQLADECEVKVNGEACRACRRQVCKSDLVGLTIVCDNLDNAAELNTCDDLSSTNYLEAFTFWDPARVSGCSLLLYRVLENSNR